MAGPIPEAIRERLAADSFMRTCCLDNKSCSGPIQWHHNLIYGGVAQQEWWSILPVCKAHHDVADNKEVKRRLNAIMLLRAGNKDVVSPYEKIRPIRV